MHTFGIILQYFSNITANKLKPFPSIAQASSSFKHFNPYDASLTFIMNCAPPSCYLCTAVLNDS